MQITDIIIICVVAAIAISDVVFVCLGIPTYSRRIKHWGERISFFPYTWGVLGGHFWSPLDAPVVDLAWWWVLAALVTIGLAFTGLHLALRPRWPNAMRWAPLVLYLPAGVPVGVVFWTM